MWLVPRLCMIGLRIGLGLRVGLHDWVQDRDGFSYFRSGGGGGFDRGAVAPPRTPPENPCLVQDQRETYSCTDKTDKHENKAIGLEVQ
jgi:hypothetical protein